MVKNKAKRIERMRRRYRQWERTHEHRFIERFEKRNGLD